MRPGFRAALRTTFAIAVLAALVVTGPVGATATAPAPEAPAERDVGARGAAAPGATGPASVQTDGPNRTGTSLVVRLRPNGNARWRVSTTFRLDDESDRDAFRDLAERFENGDAEVGFDIETLRRARDAANGTVNRTMRIRGVERRSTVVNGTDGNATGRLTLQFTWTRFATVENDTYRVGDAFTTEDGTWLPGLGSSQSLVLQPPPGFGVDTAPVAPRDGLLRWEGPREFDPGYLSVTYTRTGPVTPTTTSPPPTSPPTSPGTPASPGSPTPTSPSETTTAPPDGNQTLLLVAGLGGIIALALVIVLLARRRSDDLPGPGGEPTGTNGGTPGATTEPAESDDATEAGEEADDEAGTDPELLSDEERVERLLEENGGRMKQGNIVSETGWSNAKVSQLLSAMDDEDRVDKLRIGRENLISLPDQDVTDIENDEE